MVGAGHPAQARVDDGPHPGDGQAALGDRGGQHDAALVGGAECGVLNGGRLAAVQGQHVEVGQPAGDRGSRGRRARRPGRRRRPRRAPGGSRRRRGRAAGGRRARRAGAGAAGRRRPDDLDPEHGAGAVTTGASVPGAGHRLRASRRGRGRDEPQVGPQGRAHLGRTPRPIGVEVPLVALVDDHSATPGSSGSRCSRRSSTPVVTTSTRVPVAPRRSPRTEKPIRAPAAHLPVTPCGARRRARRAAGARRPPPGPRVGQGERHHRRLARARRRDQHREPAPARAEAIGGARAHAQPSQALRVQRDQVERLGSRGNVR